MMHRFFVDFFLSLCIHDFMWYHNLQVCWTTNILSPDIYVGVSDARAIDCGQHLPKRSMIGGQQRRTDYANHFTVILSMMQT